MLNVTILGNNSAVPIGDRHPTSQVVTCGGQRILVDCGEGTQLQLAKYHIRWGRINHIFISHLHGDHYFGLIGLLTTLSLCGRIQPLQLYGPPELKTIIDLQLDCAASTLGFPLIFNPLQTGKTNMLIEEEHMQVSCFPTNHRIPCFGFLFREIVSKRKILADKAHELGIPTLFFSALQEGKDYVSSQGTIIKNALVTADPLPGSSYAYCADTKYDESVIGFIQGCDLLYHETTYLQDQLEKAIARFHSTTIQAATLAKKAGIKKLLIGHFSSKYPDIQPFLKECQAIFPETALALEGKTFTAG
ncbi:MAG TPA: ribonuclease Z [Chitinophagaceae bacterium]|nr:ribonuclease Z [Chitinophagaceae bacterium]